MSDRRSRLSRGMTFYRWAFRLLFRAVGRWVLGSDRWGATLGALSGLGGLNPTRSDKRRLWFHAASVGELESLWPLVQLADQDGGFELVLTVFSSSAWNHLLRMSRKLEGATVQFAGYSPVEGFWTELIVAVDPDLFVTAKYEAWPEMWNALAFRGVPLAIIGAKARSSLRWAKRILGWFGGWVPRILFFSFDPENEASLVAEFPAAVVQHGSDPRWDRVFARARAPQPRVAELVSEFSDLPRPWGAIGSAWASDLVQLDRESLESFPGTLWVVPHRVEPKSISEIEILLRERGLTPVRTSAPDKLRPAGKISVLVDEMGFLAELYSAMDWAYVGGGFGSGIHSTIEPAIFGLPIVGGPRGREKFDEIRLLERQGQMRVLPAPPEAGSALSNWLQERRSPSIEGRAIWLKANQSHRDASTRTWVALQTVARGRTRGLHEVSNA